MSKALSVIAQKVKTEIDFNIRDFIDCDFNFIKNSYMKSNRNSLFLKYVDSSLYNNYQSRLFDMLVADSSVIVNIACSDVDINQILGYCIFSQTKNLIHYVYVKQPFRNLSIAKSLIYEIGNPENLEISHFPPFTKKHSFCKNPSLDKHTNYSQTFSKLKYNPYRLFEYNLGG